MLYCRIHCFRCGADFELYYGGLATAGEERGIVCPHCKASVPTETAARLLAAYNELDAANAAMRPPFTAELRNFREGRGNR